MVQIGADANSSDTFLFLGSGNNMEEYETSEENLVSIHGSPSGSKFLFNNHRYMTDSDWIIATDNLCKVIRDLPVILCFYLYILSSSLLTPCAQYYTFFAGV